MVIKHRIFTRGYKRKTPKIIKNKQAYKKITGIKTLALDRPDKPRTSRIKVKKRKPKTKTVTFPLKPYILNGLDKKTLENEYNCARLDRMRFENFIGPEARKNFQELKKFKPFLSKEVWAKMSNTARQAHLKKRRELQAKGLLIKDKSKKNKLKLSKNIIKFTNRNSRPLLKLLTFKGRREYLKSLIIAARFTANNSVLDKRKKKRLNTLKPLLDSNQMVRGEETFIKKALKLRKFKKTFRKSKLADVTYQSLLPLPKKYKKPINKLKTKFKKFHKRKRHGIK